MGEKLGIILEQLKREFEEGQTRILALEEELAGANPGKGTASPESLSHPSESLSNTVTNSPWLINPEPRPQAKLKLYCFPCEGGSASAFYQWGQMLPPSVEVCPIELPGHGKRLKELPLTSVGDLVPPLAEAIRADAGTKPFAFFGHGMGALLSIETAWQMRTKYGLLPVHLFVLGRRAPHLQNKAEQIFNLPETEFVSALKESERAPRELSENSELMKLNLPLLRADYELDETYAYYPKQFLAAPISAFSVLTDWGASWKEVVGWRVYTTASFKVQMLPAGRAFMSYDKAVLLHAIYRELESLITSPHEPSSAPPAPDPASIRKRDLPSALLVPRETWADIWITVLDGRAYLGINTYGVDFRWPVSQIVKLAKSAGFCQAGIVLDTVVDAKHFTDLLEVVGGFEPCDSTDGVAEVDGCKIYLFNPDSDTRTIYRCPILVIHVDPLRLIEIIQESYTTNVFYLPLSGKDVDVIDKQIDVIEENIKFGYDGEDDEDDEEW